MPTINILDSLDKYFSLHKNDKYRTYLHMKILCIAKGVKQQISYFSYLILSTKTVYKKF
jgi:hypothetical protein